MAAASRSHSTRGGHAVSGGCSRHSSSNMFSPPSSPKGELPVDPSPPSTIPLAPEISSQIPLPDIRTHVTSHHSSLASLEPSIELPRDPLSSPTDGSLSLGILDNFSENPILISSVVPSTPVMGVGHDTSSHAMVVESLVEVLAIPLCSDHSMETSHSDASLSSDEPNDDIILSHF